MTCKTNAQADIVLLVDGSWSIGRLNFKTIRAFISRMVGVFDIGPERVQIGGSAGQLVITNMKWSLWVGLIDVVSSGLAQYSGDPKTEWHLDTHKTRDSLLEAVSNLPYKGGNTLTGTVCIIFSCLMVSVDAVRHFRFCIFLSVCKWHTLSFPLQVWL